MNAMHHRGQSLDRKPTVGGLDVLKSVGLVRLGVTFGGLGEGCSADDWGMQLMTGLDGQDHLDNVDASCNDGETMVCVCMRCVELCIIHTSRTENRRKKDLPSGSNPRRLMPPRRFRK